MKLRKFGSFIIAIVAVVLLAGAIYADRPDVVDDDQNAPLSLAPLQKDQVRTRNIRAGAVTAAKISMSTVTVTVNAAALTGSSAAAPTLVGGTLISCVPAGNQDQFVDNVVLNGDGSITVTLAANATATNTYKVVVIKPA